MAKYINFINGKPVGSSFEDKYVAMSAAGAVEIPTPRQFEPNLVCLVDNGPFAAAAWCDSEREFERFMTGRNNRRWAWLRFPDVEKYVD